MDENQIIQEYLVKSDAPPEVLKALQKADEHIKTLKQKSSYYNRLKTRIENTGNLAPGDDSVELQEFRWIREDVIESSR